MIYSHPDIKELGDFENIQVNVDYEWLTLFNISWEEPKTI